MKNSLLTFVAFLAFGIFSFAQSVEMFPFGAAEGAQIDRFEINDAGDILSVQNTGEFFRSKNNGADWQQISEQSGGVFNSLMHHSDGSFLYVGADYSIYKISPQMEEARRLFIIPGFRFNSVLSVTGDDTGDLFALNYGQLYKSTDVGETWSKIVVPKTTDPGVVSAYDENLMALSGSDFLYLLRFEIVDNGAVTYALYRFGKDGSGFEKVFSSPHRITKLIRHSSGNLVIATNDGAFAANESELKWHSFFNEEKQFSDVSEGADGELIFVERTGCFVAVDFTSPLISLNLNNPGGRVPGTKIRWNEAANSYFIIQKNASANNFFQVTPDFGNWQALTPGAKILATDEVIFKSKKNSVFLRAMTGTEGFFVSKNGGKSFYPFLVNGQLSIRNLAKAKQTGLYAIAEDDKIYFTINEGKSWELVPFPTEVRSDDTKPFLLKTGPFGELLIGFYDNSSKLFYSNDSGQSWEKISESSFGASQVAFHPSGDIFGLFYPTAYVRPTDSAALMRYTPSKKSWTEVSQVQGVTSQFKISDKGLIHLKSAVSGVGQRTFISDDSGATLRESQLPDFYFAPNGLLFATSGQDIVLSKNNGATWEVIYSHRQQLDFRNLYLDFDNYLYAVFESGPVFRSSQPIVENNFIVGNVFIDKNGNCELDPREKHFPNAIVKAEGFGEFYAVTDETGQFSIPVFEDDYQISVRFNNQLWQTCKSDLTVSLSGSYNTASIDIPLQPVVECTSMEVDLTTPEIKKCEESIFRVKYRNMGTIKAENASVEIKLDPEFSIVDSDLSWTEHREEEGIFRFEIGDADIFEEGVFEFTTGPVCDPVVLGQTVCTEAKIFPNEICLPADNDWSGASLELTGECVGDQMAFRIKNIGLGDMIIPRGFIIIEDVALLRDPEYFAIDAGETVEFLVTPGGQSVHVSVEQVSGHPGHANPTVTLENCSTSSSGKSAQHVVSGGLTPTVEEVCQSVVDWNRGVHSRNHFGQKSIDKLEVEISPNPFSESALLKINPPNPQDTTEEYTCEIYEVTGKLISSQLIVNQEVRLNRGQMKSGFYFYKILNKNQLVASGKLAVE